MDLRVLLAAIGGLGIGAVSAMTGTGGGTLLVPLYTLVLGMDMKSAVATSLMTMPLTALSSILVYREIIDYKLGLALEATTTVGAYLGAKAVTSIPEGTLRMAFAVVLGFVAFNMLRKRESSDADGGLRRGCSRLLAAMGVSFLAGAFSGMLGIGGGTIKVPILVLVCGTGAKTAVATSMFMISITSTVGATTHYLEGRGHPLIALITATGLVVGARAGANKALRLRGTTVRRIFAAFLMLVALRIALQAWGII
ncbi:MAG: sulfite exporter TauE/SafE family protein [Candidatus Korarchaeota archaeon]|nr:sulfite exporter TauE/SafE family protein [Candidatus Korarchaeota archaeon]